MPDQHASEPVTGLEEAQYALEETTSALAQGRSPRTGRQLQEAIRRLLAANEVVPAARGYRLQALLELRRGKREKALRPARAAERLLRNREIPELGDSMDLLSRVYSEVGDHNRAVATAETWLTQTVAAPEVLRPTAARRRLALAHWMAGSITNAFTALDPLLEGEVPTDTDPTEALRVRQLAGEFLTRVGCPRAATELFTRVLKQNPPPEVELSTLLSRGWAGVCTGMLDAALRSFRRARRVAAEQGGERAETEAATALAVAEFLRGGDDTAKLATRLRRRTRQAARAGLAALEDLGERLLASPSPALSPSTVDLAGKAPVLVLQAATPKEAAKQLVALANSSESLSLVDGCCLEVEHLQALPPQQHPFPLAHWLPPVSSE